MDVRASPQGRKESDMTESLHVLEGKKIQHVSIHFRNERALTSHRAEIPIPLRHFSSDLSREIQKKLTPARGIKTGTCLFLPRLRVTAGPWGGAERSFRVAGGSGRI